MTVPLALSPRRAATEGKLARRLPVTGMLVAGILVAGMLVAGMLVAGARPAVAHPLGPPPQVVLSADGREVQLRWTAEVDDLFVIALSLGAVADTQLVEGPGEGEDGQSVQLAGPSDAAVLARHPTIPPYFTSTMVVTQDGVACPAELARRPTYDGEPAVVVATCPESVGAVDVTITTLTEVSEAYRTLVSAPGGVPDAGLHTAADATQRYHLADVGDRVPAASDPGDPASPLGPLGGLEDRMLALVDRTASSPAALLAGLLVALGVGVAHAVGPGHGKTVTAAYVAGARAARRDALLLGAAVAIMHTFSALLIGLALHTIASATGWLADTGRWLRVASGLVVLGVGVWLLRRRLRHRDHHHVHEHPHVHAGQHGHGLHTHDVDSQDLLTLRGLVLIGMSGGLVPSPSAVLVLTTGLFTGRTLYAVALVVAFGVGMALTLAVVALATGEVQRRVEARPDGRVAVLARTLPLVGAAVLVGAGALLSVTALAAAVSP